MCHSFEYHRWTYKAFVLLLELLPASTGLLKSLLMLKKVVIHASYFLGENILWWSFLSDTSPNWCHKVCGWPFWRVWLSWEKIGALKPFKCYCLTLILHCTQFSLSADGVCRYFLLLNLPLNPADRHIEFLYEHDCIVLGHLYMANDFIVSWSPNYYFLLRYFIIHVSTLLLFIYRQEL